LVWGIEPEKQRDEPGMFEGRGIGVAEAENAQLQLDVGTIARRAGRL
jgi:hypothetical protein